MSYKISVYNNSDMQPLWELDVHTGRFHSMCDFTVQNCSLVGIKTIF